MKAMLASYTLSLAAFIPVSGWMAERFGPRLKPMVLKEQIEVGTAILQDVALAPMLEGDLHQETLYQVLSDDVLERPRGLRAPPAC